MIQESAQSESSSTNSHDENTLQHVDINNVSSEDSSNSLLKRTKAFLFKWHLPIFFLCVLLFGCTIPYPGDALNKLNIGGICISQICIFDSVSDFCVALIFVNSGLQLQTNEIKAALTEIKAVTYGIISILLITPLVTFYTIKWGIGEPEFAIGLSLFFAQATSLSSGPTICTQANGNIALALLLTTVTNILAVVSMPFFVSNFLKSQDSTVSVDVNAIPISVQLIFLILFPLAFGKALRYFKVIVEIPKKRKKLLKLSSSIFLTTIIWLNISSSQNDLLNTNPGSIAILFLPALGIHVKLLVVNYLVVHNMFNLNQPEKRSLIIMSSCKSLPVALTVLQLLDDKVVGSKGLVAIPMIICHFVQIVFDAFLAAYLASIPIEKDQSLNEKEKVASCNKLNICYNFEKYCRKFS